MSSCNCGDAAPSLGDFFRGNVKDDLAGALRIQDRCGGLVVMVVTLVGVIVALVGVPRIRGSGFGIVFDCID